jgi:hypothetical protein
MTYYDKTATIMCVGNRDAVLETKVLVSRLLKDKILKSWSSLVLSTEVKVLVLKKGLVDLTGRKPRTAAHIAHILFTPRGWSLLRSLFVNLFILLMIEWRDWRRKILRGVWDAIISHDSCASKPIFSKGSFHCLDLTKDGSCGGWGRIIN